MLVATKYYINDLITSTSVAYALVCKDALISLYDMQHSLPPAVANILQEYSDVFPFLVKYHQDCPHFEGLSTRLTSSLVLPCPTVHHTGQIQKKQRRFSGKCKSYSTKVMYVSLLVHVLFQLF